MTLRARTLFSALILLLLYATSQALPLHAREASAQPGSSLQASQSHEGEDKPAATLLTIEPLGQIQVGQPVTINAQFSVAGDQSAGVVSNIILNLIVDGAREQRIKTDSNGAISVRVRTDLQAGKHSIKVEYPGSKQLSPASSSLDLVVAPAVLEIHVVPPLAGVHFLLDGQGFDSDNKGVARIDVAKAGDHGLEIPAADTESDRRLSFSRWGDDVFTSSRHVTVPLAGVLDVGFEVSNQVSETFVDLDGKPVDPGRISSLTLKSSQGTIYTFQDGQPHWLQSSTIVRRATGLEQAKIQYYVESVLISGSNVVNQAQQRFLVSPGSVWPIKLLLYSAQLTAHDALFGFPLASRVRLEYADGHSEVLPLDSHGQATVRGLPRGEYRVTVTGVQGIAPTTPIALSQDQSVELRVVTQVDMAAAGMFIVMIAVGLLVVGRPRLRRIVQRAASGPAGVAARLASPALAAAGRWRAAHSGPVFAMPERGFLGSLHGHGEHNREGGPAAKARDTKSGPRVAPAVVSFSTAGAAALGSQPVSGAKDKARQAVSGPSAIRQLVYVISKWLEAKKLEHEIRSPRTRQSTRWSEPAKTTPTAEAKPEVKPAASYHVVTVEEPRNSDPSGSSNVTRTFQTQDATTAQTPPPATPAYDNTRSTVDPLVELWLKVAEKSLRVGDYTEARIYINRVLDRDPRNDAAWHLRLGLPSAVTGSTVRNPAGASGSITLGSRTRSLVPAWLLSLLVLVGVAIGLYLQLSATAGFAQKTPVSLQPETQAAAGSTATASPPAGASQEYGVSGIFLEFWANNGGLGVFGKPISPEMIETGRDGKALRVQYFERARLEYHPENKGTQYEVMPGTLGKEVPVKGSIAYPLPQGLGGTQVLYPQTGISSPEKFVTFWQQKGGALVLGYPITPVLLDTTSDGKQIAVQYFERARLEYHADLAGTSDEIQLAPLGEQVFKSVHPGQ